MKNILVPKIGFDNIKLYDLFDKVVNELKKANISYTETILDNRDYTVKYNWRIIKTSNDIEFYFSEGNFKLFEISVKNPSIALPNGIHVKMPIEKALNIDQNLLFNEWDEIYESKKEAYYIEDSLDSGLVVSINVYIKERLDDNFEECNW